MRHRVARPASLHLLLSVVASVISPLVAQDAARRIRITDADRNPVPYALVTMSGGGQRVADDSGFVALPNLAARDSIKLTVRRVGFSPFDGWVRTDGAAPALVELTPLPRQLASVRVTERANTLLARRGFYDRLERARRGAYTARFITPEEMDLRNAASISQMLSGESGVKLNRTAGKVILSGRGLGCPMTVLLDGHPLRGMVEEVYTREGIEEHRNNPEEIEKFIRARQSVDEVVGALSVAAIEIYASAISAPVELQRNAGTESCGIIALWTGSRQ